MRTKNRAPTDESPREKAERLDRELGELLQELRVLLPGTTVLFGFFLAAIFSTGFKNTTSAERALFVFAFLTTAACAVLLTAPGVRHRMRFREFDKEALIASANRVAVAGAVLLSIALAAVSALVVEYLYGWTAGAVAGFGVFALALWFWFGWALLRDLQDGDDRTTKTGTRAGGTPRPTPATPAPGAPRRDSPRADPELVETRAAGDGRARDP
jgi:Kef-type K+ transport system membrane component KefB